MSYSLPVFYGGDERQPFQPNSIIDQRAAINLLSQRAADTKLSRRGGGHVGPPFGRILASDWCIGKNFSPERRSAMVRDPCRPEDRGYGRSKGLGARVPGRLIT
jgi:hypothetical protein